jgi:hypothetical protein
MDRRAWTFVALLLACLLGGGAFVAVAAFRDNSTDTDASAAPSAAAGALPADTRILVRAVDDSDPRLNGAVEELRPASGGKRAASGRLTCQRISFAGGRGLCLALKPSGVDYEARIFDENFEVVDRVGLTGLPSRTRVSGDGRFASTTTFVTGDSYTDPGEFSTRTTVIDLQSGDKVADLEDFEITREGEVIDSVDFNFWGITFARDPNRFYATLGTGDHHYLVRGNVRDRTAYVVADDVECPSLSPDQRRIGFKQPLGDGKWRFSVLDLTTEKRWQLSEERSIDDQLEWLDNDRLLYGDGKSVWVVQADGGGEPQRIARHADSPTALR